MTKRALTSRIVEVQEENLSYLHLLLSIINNQIATLKKMSKKVISLKEFNNLFKERRSLTQRIESIKLDMYGTYSAKKHIINPPRISNVIDMAAYRNKLRVNR